MQRPSGRGKQLRPAQLKDLNFVFGNVCVESLLS